MTVKLFDNFEAIGAQAWDALMAKSPTCTIFQTYAWQRAWWRAYAKVPGPVAAQLRLAAVYEGDELRVLMPIMRQGKVLRFVGDGMADRLDILYHEDLSKDLDALLISLKAREDWQEMELNGIPDTSPTWGYLKAKARDAGLFPLTVRRSPLWGFVLQDRDERLRRHLHTGTIAKHASIFASKGKVFVEHIQAPAPESIPWKEFFVQHVHRWCGRGAPSIFVTRAARDLCHGMAQDPFLRARMVFTRIMLNQRAAAYHLGFLHERVLYWHLPAFDIALKRFCPDDVLWREVVAHAFKCGCREVVFTSSDEPSVKRFADRVGGARSVKLFRQRREEWAARVWRWLAKIPFALQAFKLAGEFFLSLGTLMHRKKIVQGARRQVDGIDSFKDLYLKRLNLAGENFTLVKPEIEIIRRLRPELKDMVMLDMGIGQGRTGIYFAPLVKRYVAFDHVSHQVAAARCNLDDLVPEQDIVQADACDISFASNGMYDLILFSGCGLDELSEKDRARVFQEVRRVGREGAWFCFSTRNLQSLAPAVAGGYVELLRRWRRRMLMAMANENLARSRHHGSVYLADEAGGYRLPVHYVTPKDQARVLKELGFHDVRVFSKRTGLEVRDWRRWDKLPDDFLYYVCRV